MSFNIIVCIKQVPDSDKVKIDPNTGSIIRKGVPGILNSDDRNALEEALRIKDAFDDVHVVALTMGPRQALEVIYEAVAMGADEGIIVMDRALASSDTFVTSNVLKTAIEKWAGEHEPVDLIFAGREATDGDTAQVGPQIAEKLSIAQVTYASAVKLNEDMTSLEITRKLDGVHEVVEVSVPCLITAIKELNEPRYPDMRRVFTSPRIRFWNIKDLNLEADKVGLAGSPSVVISSFGLKKSKGGVFIEGDSGEEQAINLLKQLKRKHLI